MTAAEIEDAVSGVGLEPLAASVADKFQIYLDLLQKWNARLNLTAIRDPEEILQRHFIESIFAAQHLPGQIQSLLDFGSGGGFPGIPIALCRPEIPAEPIRRDESTASPGHPPPASARSPRVRSGWT